MYLRSENYFSDIAGTPSVPTGETKAFEQRGLEGQNLNRVFTTIKQKKYAPKQGCLYTIQND